MSAPLIEAGDCTNSGNNTASGSWAISRPAQSTGDLIICCLVSDANVTHGTLPAGPNGETATVLQGSYGGTQQRISVWRWIASASAIAGTVTVTPSASEQWTATVVRVPAGEFNAGTPIGASAPNNQTTTTSTSVPTAAFSAGAPDGGGRLCAWLGVNADPITGTPGGWTNAASVDRGAVSGTFATRNVDVDFSESIGSYSWTIAGDTSSTLAFIVRGVQPPPHTLRNYQFVRVGDGMSTSEKIR